MTEPAPHDDATRDGPLDQAFWWAMMLATVAIAIRLYVFAGVEKLVRPLLMLCTVALAGGTFAIAWWAFRQVELRQKGRAPARLDAVRGVIPVALLATAFLLPTESPAARRRREAVLAAQAAVVGADPAAQIESVLRALDSRLAEMDPAALAALRAAGPRAVDPLLDILVHPDSTAADRAFALAMLDEVTSLGLVARRAETESREGRAAIRAEVVAWMRAHAADPS